MNGVLDRQMARSNEPPFAAAYPSLPFVALQFAQYFLIRSAAAFLAAGLQFLFAFGLSVTTGRLDRLGEPFRKSRVRSSVRIVSSSWSRSARSSRRARLRASDALAMGFGYDTLEAKSLPLYRLEPLEHRGHIGPGL